MKRTNVYLDEQQLRKLAEIAARMDRSVSWLIRDAINKYIEAQAKGKKGKR